MTKPTAPLTRLMRRVVVDDAGCWNWTGATSSGYGYMAADLDERGYTNWRTHRIAYVLANGPIPSGRGLDHLCRNRSCCNPRHLEPVTWKENTRRGDGPAGINARKSACPEGHPYTDENTYVAPGSRNKRTCRACRKARQARYYQERKAGLR
jgi:hypothetical protein